MSTNTLRIHMQCVTRLVRCDLAKPKGYARPSGVMSESGIFINISRNFDTSKSEILKLKRQFDESLARILMNLVPHNVKNINYTILNYYPVFHFGRTGKHKDSKNVIGQFVVINDDISYHKIYDVIEKDGKISILDITIG